MEKKLVSKGKYPSDDYYCIEVKIQNAERAYKKSEKINCHGQCCQNVQRSLPKYLNRFVQFVSDSFLDIKSRIVRKIKSQANKKSKLPSFAMVDTANTYYSHCSETSVKNVNLHN